MQLEDDFREYPVYVGGHSVAVVRCIVVVVRRRRRAVMDDFMVEMSQSCFAFCCCCSIFALRIVLLFVFVLYGEMIPNV